MKFIHASDLHYHRSKQKNAAADATLECINERYPDHNLIVTGDIVDDGHPTQYRNAHAALSQFGERVFVAPGNHDFGAVGNLHSRERALRFDEFLSVPLSQGGTFTGDNTPVVNVLDDGESQVMLIALDTNLETDHAFDFACGKVGKSQRRALDSILSTPEAARMVKIVFFHHHPWTHANPFIELKDAKALLAVLFQRVEVVLFGHRHTMGRWENATGIQYVLAADNRPGKNVAWEVSVAGQSVSVNELDISTS